MAEENAKKKFNPVIAILIVIIIALIGGAAVFGMKYLEAVNSKQESGIKTEPNVFLNDEDAEKFVEDKVSSINISMTQTIRCYTNDEGKLMAKVNLVNRNEHQYLAQFVMADTNEVIYTTGLIPPDGELEEIPIEMDLESGTYSVNAIFSLISEKDNETDIGSSGVNVNMVVE